MNSYFKKDGSFCFDNVELKRTVYTVKYYNINDTYANKENLVMINSSVNTNRIETRYMCVLIASYTIQQKISPLLQ